MEREVLGFTELDDAKRAQLLDDKIWITRDGEEIRLSQMELSHLANAILCIMPFKREDYFKRWLRLLRKQHYQRTKQYYKQFKKI